MSDIVSTTINENFPVAGQDNPSQGFRDNFQAIKTALTVAKSEITALQNDAFIANQDNDLTDTVLGNATVRNFKSSVYKIDNTNGSFAIYDYALSDNQEFTVTESIAVFQIINVPDLEDIEQSFKVSFVISDIEQYVSLNGIVISNLTDDIAYLDESESLKFAQTGTYEFEFTTTDGGTSYLIKDLTRNKKRSEGQLELWANSTVLGKFYHEFDSNVGDFISVLQADKIIANNYVNIQNNDQAISGDLIVDGNIQSNWILANVAFVGQLATPTQSNITSIGTLTSLEVSGNATLGTNGSSTVNTLFGKTDICGVFMTQVTTTSSTNFSVGATDNTIICSGSGTHSPDLPNNINDGQRFSFAFQNNVTVNFQSTGGADVTNLSGIAATPSNGITLVYHNGRYYRI